jgi:quercetin dioxygenase-like cupin family protein
MELLAKTPTVKAPAERFTGDVWVDMLAIGEAPSRLTAAAVHFAPCARTAWHRHALGQTLHVTEGIGLVQTRDGRTIVLRPGDTVHTPPGEWHWHGAAPEHFMTHIALSEGSGAPDVSDVDWGELVTDDVYEKANASA